MGNQTSLLVQERSSSLPPFPHCVLTVLKSLTILLKVCDSQTPRKNTALCRLCSEWRSQQISLCIYYPWLLIMRHLAKRFILLPTAHWWQVALCNYAAHFQRDRGSSKLITQGTTRVLLSPSSLIKNVSSAGHSPKETQKGGQGVRLWLRVVAACTGRVTPWSLGWSH